MSDANKNPAATPAAAKKAKTKKLVVAPRQALTSKVGILGEGAEVSPELFNGDGAAVIKAFKSSGHIVEIEVDEK